MQLLPPYNFPEEELRPAGTLGLKPGYNSPFYKRDPQNPMLHWPPEVMYVLDSYPHIKQQLVDVLTIEWEAGRLPK
ncbi:MAG: hypothetical protein U0R19_09155 [Bryobacteraceae bacterium]